MEQLAATFSLLSLEAVGGANATLPEMHRQIVDNLHFMDDATFANLVAIAQTAPGPNVIVMSMMGWHIAGLAGLGVATAAMVSPSSFIALAAERILRRFSASQATSVLKKALAPIAVGLMGAGGLVLARAADGGGFDDRAHRRHDPSGRFDQNEPFVRHCDGRDHRGGVQSPWLFPFEPPGAQMGRIAYVNGRYVASRDAMVHIEDRGYQLADGRL